MQAKLQNINNLNIQSLLNQSIRDNEKVILDMNRSQMWDDGTVDVTRTGRREAYSRVTVKLKKEFARYKKTDFITLKWDGDFHDSLYIEYEPNQFTIKSDDPKWVISLEPQPRFENALGLTNENKARLRQVIKDQMLRNIRHAI